VSVIETGTPDLRAEVRDRVGLITMNRPSRRNALSQSMLDSLGTVLARFESDDEIRCVVLTGSEGAFCAGGDVKGMAGESVGERDPRSSLTMDARIQRQRLNQRATSLRLWSMGKPTIAAINGPAAGAGLSLALACDLRYAVEGAVLTTAFARVGFAGDYGGTWFLTKLVGSGRAKELYYFSERISAAAAAGLGIVNEVFGADAFEAEVWKRARRLADGPSVAYRYMKENLNRAVDGELGECLDLEVTHHLHTSLTEDHREAAKAFVEKREPTFRGR
jgi:2-(1,2-epoxy-1,2-dihydrophenyl)acetyl-CoA isomerase